MEKPWQKWWHVSPIRIVIALVVVFALMWMIGQAVQWLAPWTEARSMLRENPALSRLPVAPPDQSVAPLAGFRIELFGIAVQTPWSKIGTVRLDPDMALAPFPDQHVAMTLFDPGTDDFEKRMWAESTLGRDEHNAISGYNLMSAEMSATPDGVKWWRGPKGNEARSFLLEMKALRLRNLRDIYSVSAGTLKGYQEGNPNVQPYEVRLDLFDSAGQHYQIRIASTDTQGPIISQSQINAMVASIKSIPVQ